MPEVISFPDISAYHRDCQAGLRILYSEANPEYQARFVGYTRAEVAGELRLRLGETDMRSALVVMAHMEAKFRLDYKFRAQKKLPDDISINFRKIWKKKGEKARLIDDIFSVWKNNVEPEHKAAIGELKKFFNLRHWIAHGRYWQFTTSYDYNDVYAIVDYLMLELAWAV
ncbi:hypothetical protein J2792_000542 [Novosphingobium capsulatum]|uniref:RiboL-PSP-HEPN domain-containing protein n=1 Tax=Novosphingobium capsulatum TaxID=13688 RepID=A0ABU1MI29_9SPHN|nr:hypothetical protein [Novosphingobium capsulatum]MDR6509702.1 hypothetical protein [Novosphingobium capsulatum]